MTKEYGQIFTGDLQLCYEESSAYKRRSQSTARGISLTYKRKISGPREEPCGTPHDNLPGNEYSFPTFTKKVRFVRYDFSQKIAESAKPMCFIF